MKFTAKQILIIIAVVFVILITVGVWFYLKGKKTVTIQKPPLDDPGSGADANNPNAVSNGEITTIASGLFEDMNGFNWAGHNEEPYRNLDSLSDTDFVNVYNTFNTAHQAESKQTLKQWIEAEDYAFRDIIDSILSRMGRLNLI